MGARQGLRKPRAIFDREAEWQELESAWGSPRAELILMLGRRRVGKSFLLSHFVTQTGGIYYQATRRTSAEQLARLTRIVGETLQDTALMRGAALPDWEALFDYLTERAGGKRFLLVIDDFPYLTAAAAELPSILQSFWDHRWKRRPFKIVLSGSLVTAMQQLEREDQPLYGRRTRRIVVTPFAYNLLQHFVPRYGARDLLRTYGIFGGLPGNLELLDPDVDLGQNVARLILTPSGRLSDEAQHMLDAFLEDAVVHYSIIEAIAAGDRTWRGITNRVGKSGGSLHRPLEWLQAMGIVERVVPVTEAQPRKSKKVLYRITDPYVAFWHRFVSPLVSAGSLGLTDGLTLWQQHVEPALDDYMGSIFEQVCRHFVGLSRRLPFRPQRVGEWWSGDSTEQIDVVALGPREQVLAGESKWGAVTMEDLETLRRRVFLLTRDLAGISSVHLALFTGQEIRDRELRGAAEAGELLLFGPKDLCELEEQGIAGRSWQPG